MRRASIRGSWPAALALVVVLAVLPLLPGLDSDYGRSLLT